MNTKDKAIIYLDNSIKHLSELIKNSNVDSSKTPLPQNKKSRDRIGYGGSNY